jgi:hypothetical protein
LAVGLRGRREWWRAQPSIRTYDDVVAVTADAFRTWIAPLVAAIRDFALAVDAVSERFGGLPTAESRAMSERAEEASYSKRSSWEQPVTDTHLLGAATLRAASDYLRAFAELFRSDHPPLYAHLTVTRAALEAGVVSAWLNEPGIARIDRIKRGLCEMLYSANEVNALELDPDGPEHVAFWKEVGACFGWTVNNSRTKPVIDDTRRPRISDGIVAVASDDGSRVGGLLYSRLSAVDHVTWFGLQSAFDLDAAHHEERARTSTVPIIVDAVKVSMYAYYVVRVVRAAAQARFTLMGWLDEEWAAATAGADGLQERLLKIVTQPPMRHEA